MREGLGMYLYGHKVCGRREGLDMYLYGHKV